MQAKMVINGNTEEFKQPTGEFELTPGEFKQASGVLKQPTGEFKQASEGSIHSVINRNTMRHSRKSGNPGKHWIPGQARNDNLHKTYVVVYKQILAASNNTACRVPTGKVRADLSASTVKIKEP